MKSRIIFFLIAGVTIGCSPAITDFNAQTDINRYFLHDLLDTAKVTHVESYKTVFYEELIEDETLIENTMRSENSTREVIHYRDRNSELHELRELYIFMWLTPDTAAEGGWRENYVYFSAKFRALDHTKVCIGFGPSYFGTAEIVNKYKVITFTQNLRSKPAREGNKKHYLRKKSFSDKLQFVIAPDDYTESRFIVSKVINNDVNKIGGKKNLVYEVGNIIGDIEALRFNYITSF